MSLPSLSGDRKSQRSLTAEPIERNLIAVRFHAMASPCEVLFAGVDHDAALSLANIVSNEAWRIERKFSRYRDDSVIAWIHRNRGVELEVDDETAALLNFAASCFELSDGLFDVTSGVLRRVWTFDGSDRLPRPEAIAQLLPHIGFDKVRWLAPRLLLPREMELDFGGIGKEYAVDRAYDALARKHSKPFLINFGGDLRANRAPPKGAWRVGIERPDTEREAALMLEIKFGALTTSGDARRFLLKDGVRYGHILNPRTGWPVRDGPRSITVAASSCIEAGLLSTLAMLQGPGALPFLETQGVKHWITV